MDEVTGNAQATQSLADTMPSETTATAQLSLTFSKDTLT